jgi:hypothetical protein
MKTTRPHHRRIHVLNKKSRRDFTANDEALLNAFATEAAVSIDNSRLFLSVVQKNMQLLETKEKLEQSVRHLKLLFELESTMGRATSQEELIRGVLEESARACEAAGGAVLLTEEEGGLAGLWDAKPASSAETCSLPGPAFPRRRRFGPPTTPSGREPVQIAPGYDGGWRSCGSADEHRLGAAGVGGRGRHGSVALQQNGGRPSRMKTSSFTYHRNFARPSTSSRASNGCARNASTIGSLPPASRLKGRWR